MTAAEIEKQADIYANEKVAEIRTGKNSYNTLQMWCDRASGFVDGAKWGMEHAIEWHDLRKDPNDLPKDEEDFKEYLVAHKNFNNPNEIVVGCFTWYGGRFLENYTYSEIPYFENKNVLYAWCEPPQFKE